MSGLKKRYPLVGYLALNPDEDLEDSAFTAYIPLANVSNSWDVTVLEWADADENSARVTFKGCFQPECPNHETESQFIAAVKARVTNGSVVQISLERSNGNPYKIDTDAKATTFVTTIKAIVDKYGFNGVDIYLTDVACGGDGDGQDFLTARDQSSVHLISAVQTLRGTYGSSFVLSLTANIHSSGAGIDGQRSCLAVIHALRDVVDVFYLVPVTGSGQSIYTDVDGSNYEYTTPEYLVASASLLLAQNGTPVQNSSELFPPLRAEQLFVLAELTHNLHDQYFRVNISTTQDALACIARGERCHSYQVTGGAGALEGFRGFVADLINDDERDGGAFRKGMTPLLDALANNASLPSTSGSSSPSSSSSDAQPSSAAEPTTAGETGTSARTLALVIVLPLLAALLLACLAVWYWRLRRRRARELSDIETRPYISETSTSRLQVPSAQVPSDTLRSRSDAAVVSASSPTEKGRTILQADQHAEDSHSQADPVAPERIAVLQDAIRRAGFSVDALVTSLHRVAPEADGDAEEHPPTYHLNDDTR
ncbi:hypothetical protein EXIGLDRAFT_841140 [Exidia glandulosa HHB12029]|uniref:Chitinase n=1 Tax=Exidia glandulosa HHB12029 TaxID=1314781 RepID=A0A165E2E9_EXIGL|nr:hypothetical protein EXIGLDRAFT_841140 [Exidia glandulosa HHB12029]